MNRRFWLAVSVLAPALAVSALSAALAAGVTTAPGAHRAARDPATAVVARPGSPAAASRSAAPPAPSPAARDAALHLKPGARGKACIGCHADFEETLKLPFVHTPVKNGSCSDCHNPHASDHGKLLAGDPEKICLTCHAGLVPKDAKSVHETVVAGQCVKCHDPHASKYKGALLEAGNALCLSCHKEIGAAVDAAAFKHSPVAQGCLSCHTPHASTASEHLLKKSVPALCADCHRTDQPVFAKQHQNYPVGKSDCTSCHDPHGSSQKGILWASVHAPVANRMCAQCHSDPATPGALLPKKLGAELCRTCHAEMVNTLFAKERLHWPVGDASACLNCHTPHASRAKPLLKRAPKELCGSCHADTIARQARSLTKHPPIEAGECASCHDPHASDAPFLLVSKDELDLCGTCHEWQRHSSHPIGAKVIDPRNKNLSLDCSSCHRAHGSSFKAFLHADPKADLCVGCHEDLKR